MTTTDFSPQPVTLPSPDGYSLRGFIWRHPDPRDESRPVVIINPATSVRCRYYARFAAFLFSHGFDVVTYDYRGIGESHPGSLRGFKASWMDWGRLDFEAALRFAAGHFPGQPIQVVGHSVGGFLIGLAPSNHLVRRVFTMGAQFAVWKDYAAHRRLGMFCKWHIVMPLLASLLGYFPGKRLGWMEDTPRGVVRDWTATDKRFEEIYRQALGRKDGDPLGDCFAALTAPTLAVSITDDPFGTVAAIERLLARFGNSPATHLRLPPAAIGETEIGHFAFFHSRFQESLWPIPLAWLQSGHLQEGYPGRIVTHRLREYRPAGMQAAPEAA